MTGPHPYLWLNGDLVPADAAHISPLDAGFLLGDGLFETMRVYGGRILDLDRHLDRLARSAEVLRLTVPPKEAVAEGLTALIERNACGDAVCRLTVTRGPGPRALGLPQVGTQTTLAYTTPLPRYALTHDPVSLVTSALRLDPGSPLAGHKTTSYLPFLWARQEALDRGADEALLLNTAGQVAECATANVFAVFEGDSVVTPPVSAGCLPGIVRGVVLEICADLGLPAAEERHLTPDDLHRADEVFITNSVREITPVAGIDGRALPESPGEVTKRLLDAYRARALRQTGDAR